MGDDEYILSFWARRADKAGTGILDDGEAFVGAWFAPCNNDPKIFKMPEDGKWRFYSVAIHKTQNLEDLPVFMGGHKVLIDDIRLVTRDARVTTYTHEPHVGVTSIIDENNQTVFYEYDDFGRLRAAFDTDGNLLQANQYQLSQP